MLRREGWSFKCVLGSFEKLVRSRGRRKIWVWNLGPDYTRQAGPLCGKPGTLDKRNKNQLCDYMTTEPARLAGIPVLWCLDPGGNFPSNHPFRAARGLNQAKNRRTGNIGHCFPGSCDQALIVSCIVTQFARESFGIAVFVVRVWENTIEYGLHVKMLDSASFTVRPWKNAICLRGHFAQ